MIANREGTVALSSMGWVDRDALWRFDAAAGQAETVPLGSGASYVSLHALATGSDRFAVAHHFEGRRFEISVRCFAAPSVAVARAAIGNGESSVAGDPATWAEVPRLFVSYLAFEPWKDDVLLRVSPQTGRIEVQRFEWYDQTYDKGYQSVIDVLELPGQDHALVSVQRSSRLILHDLANGVASHTIDLGGNGGNPKLRLRDPGDEVWATDYDTLAVVRTGNWRVRKRARLQRAAAGTQQFIGDFSFPPDADLCVVARPLAGDVVGVDARTLEVTCAAQVGRQPLDVAALPGGQVVARDWKTGDLLRGTLARR